MHRPDGMTAMHVGSPQPGDAASRARRESGGGKPAVGKRGTHMFGRRRRPLMRAAMVGGVAYHAGKRVQEGREEDYDRDQRIAELEARQAPNAPAAAPAAAPQVDIEQLEKLAQLKDQGILTQAEFDVQKAKLLAGGS